MSHYVRAGAYAVGDGDETFSVIGLGSCVAVILYDREAGVGGLAHVLLPDPSLSTSPERRMRFASTAIPLLLDEMEALGARRERVEARLVGGASMFGELLASDRQNIGARNVEKAREVLASEGLELVGEDVGGDFGRNLRFELEDGSVRVKSFRRADDVLV